MFVLEVVIIYYTVFQRVKLEIASLSTLLKLADDWQFEKDHEKVTTYW
jgi:hypothetical protein